MADFLKQMKKKQSEPDDSLEGKNNVVRIDAKLYKKIKLYCVLNDIQIMELMNKLVQHGLDDHIFEDVTKQIDKKE